MKILFVGYELISQHFVGALEGEEITIANTSDVTGILKLIGENEFDLAIVDGTLPSAEKVCKRIGELEIMPVVLIVHQFEERWSNLQSVCADAYITESATNPEILARIRAIYRRSKRIGLPIQQ